MLKFRKFTFYGYIKLKKMFLSNKDFNIFSYCEINKFQF